MDKEYMLSALRDRIDVLKRRYFQACSGTGDSVAAQIRHSTKRDWEMCELILQLVTLASVPELVTLNDKAMHAFEKLIAPIERHRALKEDVGV